MALLRERSCSSQSQHGLLVSGHSRRPTPSSRTSTSLPTPDLAGRSPLPPPPALRVIGLCAATSAVLATYLRPQVPWLSLTVCPQYSSFVSWRSSNEQNQKLLLSHFARCHCDSRFHADWRRRSLVGISVINSYDFFLPRCQAGSDKIREGQMVAVTVWHLLLIRECLFAHFRMVIVGSCLSWKSLNASKHRLKTLDRQSFHRKLDWRQEVKSSLHEQKEKKENKGVKF